MLKIIVGLFLSSLALTSVAAGEPAARAAPCRGALVYIGSVAPSPDGGVSAARLDESNGRLCSLGHLVQLRLPTWMTLHPRKPVLYVTDEASGPTEPGIFAYRIDTKTGALEPINSAPSGGAGPTFLSVDPGSRTMFAVHWNSGHVSALPVRDDGGLEPPVSVEAPAPMQAGAPVDRQRSRTHQVQLDPSRRFAIVTEYGLDRILIYRFDRATRQLTPSEPAYLQLPANSGPRHYVVHPKRPLFYVLNERTSEVGVYRWNAARASLQLEQTIATSALTYTGRRHSAGIVMSPDARFLYVSNRAEDVLVAYAIDTASGRLSEVQRVASGGRTPRDFALSPSGRWMVVGNQESNSVNVFARDLRTGRLRLTDQSMTSPLPVVFTFAPGGTSR